MRTLSAHSPAYISWTVTASVGSHQGADGLVAKIKCFACLGAPCARVLVAITTVRVSSSEFSNRTATTRLSSPIPARTNCLFCPVNGEHCCITGLNTQSEKPANIGANTFSRVSTLLFASVFILAIVAVEDSAALRSFPDDEETSPVDQPGTLLDNTTDFGNRRSLVVDVSERDGKRRTMYNDCVRRHSQLSLRSALETRHCIRLEETLLTKTLDHGVVVLRLQGNDMCSLRFLDSFRKAASPVQDFLGDIELSFHRCVVWLMSKTLLIKCI